MNVFCEKDVCVPIIPSQKNKSQLGEQGEANCGWV